MNLFGLQIFFLFFAKVQFKYKFKYKFIDYIVYKVH